MKKANLIISLLVVAFFSGCELDSINSERRAIIQISNQSLHLHREGQVKKFSVSTGQKGVGGKPGSNRTPLGHFYVGVKKKGQYGWCVELHGVCEQGYEQNGRYIEIHGTTAPVGRPLSRGCVRCTYQDLPQIISNLKVGDSVTIIR